MSVGFAPEPRMSLLPFYQIHTVPFHAPVLELPVGDTREWGLFRDVEFSASFWPRSDVLSVGVRGGCSTWLREALSCKRPLCGAVMVLLVGEEDKEKWRRKI